MIINKENITTYKNILFNAEPKSEIWKYMFKRLLGIPAFFSKDVYVDNGRFVLNCGRIMENCKVAVENFELELKEVFLSAEYGTWIDVGANIGKHTTMMSLFTKDVYAFEPDFRNLRLLRENVKDLNNVKVFPYAVSNENGEIKLNYDDHHPARTSVSYDWKNSMEVDCRTLDHFSFQDVKLIKIDVEGHELEVLEGAKELIKEQRPLIVFEAWNDWKLLAITNFLEKYGYNFEKIDEFNYVARCKK